MEDLASKEYWDNVWKTMPLPRTIHPSKNPIHRRLSRFLTDHCSRGGRMLEIGCAASPSMPFLGKHLGYELWGVDYSEQGLALTKKNLEYFDVQSHLMSGDFVALPLNESYFDLVYSYGVVEHYSDPTPLFKKAAAILRPGGLNVTVIPNNKGIYGWTQKFVDRKVYDVHMLFDEKDLDRFQLAAGLESVVASEPFGVFDLGLLNWENRRRQLPYVAERFVAYTMQTLDRIVGRATFPFRHAFDSSLTSPLIISLFRKPLNP